MGNRVYAYKLQVWDLIEYKGKEEDIQLLNYSLNLTFNEESE
jgi:hypothetical protein